MRPGDLVPAELGHVQEHEDHGEALHAAAGPLRHPFTQAHGGERRLDGIGGSQVAPVLGREGEECQQGLSVLGEAVCGLGIFGLVVGEEAVELLASDLLGLGVHDIPKRIFDLGLQTLGELVQDVDHLVAPIVSIGGVSSPGCNRVAMWGSTTFGYISRSPERGSKGLQPARRHNGGRSKPQESIGGLAEERMQDQRSALAPDLLPKVQDAHVF